MNRFMRPSAPYTYPHRGSLEVTKFGVQELNAKEMIEVEGGRIPWKSIERFLTLVGIYDAIEDFKEGWNSVDCGC